MSPTNRRVVRAAKLTISSVRASEGKILLEGRHLLDEALEAHLVPEIVFALDASDAEAAASVGAMVASVSESVMAKLATTHHPTGPVAVVPMPELAGRPTGSAVVLWGIGDPGNLGTALRSCAALGVDSVVGPGCADVWNPKVLRAAAGGHFRGVVVLAPDLTIARLHEWDLEVWAAVPRGGIEPGLLPMRQVAVLVGSEGSGLGLTVEEAADHRTTIPMANGMESLNAGVTASLYAHMLASRIAREPGLVDD